MKINQISFKNFRNFSNVDINFQDKTNIFFGDNGSGKTNILEGISLISKGRGIRNSSIKDFIKNEEKNFYIKSNIEIKNNEYDIEIFSNSNDEKLKKIVTINNDTSIESKKFLNSSVSFLNFLPEMERLFQSSPSYRRNFIDRLIFSEDNNYNKLINKYKKYITERGIILQNNNIDLNWISYLETEISRAGLQIYQLRQAKLKMLNESIDKLNDKNNYQFKINFSIIDSFYNSNLDEVKYIDLIKDCREFDRAFGGLKFGPHKSDICAQINNNYDASKLSTGQQKTIVLLTLLAQCNYLVNDRNIEPILLLDEICSHLDKNNRNLLLELINQFDIQFFLTGTEKNLFSFISTNVKFYNITIL